jgi:hypothetical protein
MGDVHEHASLVPAHTLDVQPAAVATIRQRELGPGDF